MTPSVSILLSCVFFFFKQKTAYEMRISDWSSDVCSSDLLVRDFQSVIGREARAQMLTRTGRLPDLLVAAIGCGSNAIGLFHPFLEIGRASCRERVCQYV